MNPNRTALLKHGLARIKCVVAVPVFLTLVILSVPFLFVLYWLDIGMSWAESTFPDMNEDWETDDAE